MRKQVGYTLLEIMLGIAILMAGVLMVYAFMKPASLKAGVEKEQKHLSSLVSTLEGAFGTTQGHYGQLTMESASQLRISNVKFDGVHLNSMLGDNMLLRPATVREANDAFDVVYQNLDSQKCLQYIQSFYPQSYTILVGSAQTPVQQTSGTSEGRLVGEDVLSQACSNGEFKQKQGAVAFRFFKPLSVAVSATDQVCGCTPETQTQTLACADGQTGSIEQQRTSTCNGGTGACPTAVWTAWTTTSNTCSGGPTAITPSAVVDPGDGLCVSGTENRTTNCPAGQTGYITESRTSTCATSTSTPVWGAWAVTKDTCSIPTSEAITCTPATETQNVACPAGQGGQITQTRSSTCSSPTATPVWGAWIETNRNCSVACVSAGNCCAPQPDEYRTVNCNAGYYGQSQEERSSYCSTATSPLQWNAWSQTSTTCTACPAPSTATETRWVPNSSSSCPAGQYGGNSWEYEQARTQTTSYNCPAGTTALPAPTVGAWTAWTDTGNTRGGSSTCANCPAPTTETQTQWVADSSSCPSGQTGSITWEKEQTNSRSVSYACPAGTAALPAPSYGTWSGWTDTGNTRNLVNSCAASCASPRNDVVTRFIPCGDGLQGNIEQQATMTYNPVCPSSPQKWETGSQTSSWATVNNTCTPTSTCSPPASEVETRPGPACPAGQTGVINERRVRSFSCPSATGAFVDNGWTSWEVYENTCAPASCSGPNIQWVNTFHYYQSSSGSDDTIDLPLTATEANAVQFAKDNATQNTWGQANQEDWGESSSYYAGDCTSDSSTIGRVRYNKEYSVDCVENYGSHACDYQFYTDSEDVFVCRDTCAPAPKVTPAQCIAPSPETRTDPCPSGQVGGITMRRAASCPTATGTPVWGSWYEVSRSCAPPATGGDMDNACFNKWTMDNWNTLPNAIVNVNVGGVCVFRSGEGTICYKCP